MVVALPPKAFAYKIIGAPSVIWKFTALNKLNRKEFVAWGGTSGIVGAAEAVVIPAILVSDAETE
jgi:hypothetical protein